MIVRKLLRLLVRIPLEWGNVLIQGILRRPNSKAIRSATPNKILALPWNKQETEDATKGENLALTWNKQETEEANKGENLALTWNKQETEDANKGENLALKYISKEIWDTEYVALKKGLRGVCPVLAFQKGSLSWVFQFSPCTHTVITLLPVIPVFLNACDAMKYECLRLASLQRNSDMLPPRTRVIVLAAEGYYYSTTLQAALCFACGQHHGTSHLPGCEFNTDNIPFRRCPLPPLPESLPSLQDLNLNVVNPNPNPLALLPLPQPPLPIQNLSVVVNANQGGVANPVQNPSARQPQPLNPVQNLSLPQIGLPPSVHNLRGVANPGHYGFPPRQRLPPGNADASAGESVRNHLASDAASGRSTWQRFHDDAEGAVGGQQVERGGADRPAVNARGQTTLQAHPQGPVASPEPAATRGLCRSCRDQPADILFGPCSHIICCQMCSESVEDCDVCGRHVDAKIKVYRA
ncbi:hypothetical protein V1264_015028 [Littorina saxatilis]|uniref:RING-type domain-containing protein n=2 Tax=Littorina saxatilis TaxID=31220 RepID=A0AAN9GGI9_9CAEN